MPIYKNYNILSSYSNYKQKLQNYNNTTKNFKFKTEIFAKNSLSKLIKTHSIYSNYNIRYSRLINSSNNCDKIDIEVIIDQLIIQIILS